MSWYDPDEPLISFKITAYIEDLTKAGRKKLLKQINNALDDEDTARYDYALSKGNKVLTIDGVTNYDAFEELEVLLDKWQLEWEGSYDRASDFYNEPDGGMGWRDTDWD